MVWYFAVVPKSYLNISGDKEMLLLETIIKGSTYNCSSGGLSWKTLDSITFGGVLNVWTLMIGPLELIGMDPNSISPSIFTSDPGRVYYDTEQIEILVT